MGTFLTSYGFVTFQVRTPIFSAVGVLFRVTHEDLCFFGSLDRSTLKMVSFGNQKSISHAQKSALSKVVPTIGIKILGVFLLPPR